MGEELWAEYIFHEPPQSRLGRDLYEHGEVRLDLPVYDPWRSAPAWAKFHGLTQAEAQRAALLYGQLRTMRELKGERLRTFIARAVRENPPWVQVLLKQEEEQDQPQFLPLEEELEEGDDLPAEGLHDEPRSLDAVHWRTVQVPLQPVDEKLPPVPEDPYLEDWWERVRSALSGGEAEAHRVFRREVRRNRLRRAWLDICSLLPRSGEWEVESLTARVFRKPIPVRGISHGKVVLAGGVKVNPEVFLKSLSRRLRPAWVRLLLSGLKKSPEKAKAVVGRLLDRELAKEQMLAQVVLPPMPGSGAVKRRGQKRDKSWDYFVRQKEREEKRDQCWSLARELLRRGEARAAARVLRSIGVKLGKYFVIKDFPELGLTIRHPRSEREAALEERKLFFRILNLNGRLTPLQKRYLLQKWYPYARRLLFRLAGCSSVPKVTVLP